MNGSPLQGRCPPQEVNDRACPKSDLSLIRALDGLTNLIKSEISCRSYGFRVEKDNLAFKNPRNAGFLV